ncbi:unnamed protein product, partial [Thelazia callipaeda]|uniref:Fibronectin type-III domain-containing protein n=1 Tax=Thelazia callipaeda TaxID=103827 RepID=A0A0N5CMM7_THECL
MEVILPSDFSDHQQSGIVLAMNGTGRCVVSANKASHYCGEVEVTAPPFPPSQAGQCHFSSKSGRQICWPRYEVLDTSCTDIGNGMVSAPAIKHAAIRSMAFVPPDNLRRIIRLYYRKQGMPLPRNITYSKNSFLFVRYECDHGYEFVDEVNSMFCANRQWITTSPKCRGKGLCEINNGGCSHSCLSIQDQEVECHCPNGFVLDSNKKTCIKPIPKNLCRILSSCSCSTIDENQYSCTCPKGEKCLLLRGRPKIYIEPSAPYEIAPGGNLNITCSAVSYPFPQIFWQRGDEAVDIAPVKPGTVRSEQILIIKELYKNTQFTCHANNSLGKAERTIEIVVTGPGSAPIIRGIGAGRTSVYVRWDPPVILNRPVTSYTVYYTISGHKPIKNWRKLNVEEPNREIMIKDLRPHTQYFIRLRANDKLGPGRLSSPVSLKTRQPAARPQLHIPEGNVVQVPPLVPFKINCNVTRGDPLPKIAWYTRARPINKPQKKKFITMEHGGLYESTNFSCVADNEAGRTSKRVQVIVTGPTSPERIRYQIDGNNVDLQWEPPRITNGHLKDYEVMYTDDLNLPEEQWQVARAGSADARMLRVPNLKEKTDYTFKLRAYNELGPGLSSGQFTLTTWLAVLEENSAIAARSPAVTIVPAVRIIRHPSNEELIFECEAVGVPRPKILWLWSGGLIEDGKNEFRIYDVTPSDAQDRSSSKLIAERTNRAGVATCQAVNPHGSDEKRTEVKIVGPGSPPRNISSSPSFDGFRVTWNPPKYPNGKITKYIIYYTKNPDAALEDWEQISVDGQVHEATVLADEDTPYNVRIRAFTKDGPGIVSEAYDVTTGKKPVPLTIKLIIMDPPVQEGSFETTIEPLQMISFTCQAEGRPAPQISYTWLPFNETESGQEPVPIPAYSDPTQVHKYHSLAVETNTATKRALMCNARNPDGTVSDQHIFNVIKPGSPPENIHPIIDPDNRVTISWQEPKYPNGPILKYKAYLTSDPAKPIDSWDIYYIPIEETQGLVLERGKLQPETPYYIKVAAVGEGGEGVQSDSILFETVSGAPVDAPKDLLATVQRDNTIDISWAGPSIANGPIQSYTIYFTPVDQLASDDLYKQWDKVIVPSNKSTENFQLNKDTYNIMPNREYRIRISSTNDLSEGPASESITVKTESGETLPVIHLEPSHNPAIVPPHGTITVQCTATGIPPPSVIWIIGINASDVIRGSVLQLTDVYRDEMATCKAENSAGQVQEVLQILVSGPGTPPNEIVALPLENQQANIEWTTPDSPNGKITDYVVHYGEVMNGEAVPREWQTIRIPAAESQKYRLTGLKPKANYAVRLQAISDRGPGVLSDPVHITALPLAPAIVQPNDVVVHDNNTVAIQFDAPRDPEDPEKPIKEFVVHYTDDDPTSENAHWTEMFWTEPDDDFTVSIPIGGEHFKPDTKYSIKVIARGEIDGPPSEPIIFQTGDGIIPPEKPKINADAPDSMIRVPAGSDYTVSCSSSGYPTPTITWIDKNDQLLSDGPMLRLQDVKETVNAKCVAENEGGRAETPFEIFVTGPGSAPNNIRLNSLRPRTIHVDWDPPKIPNGNIIRYIIYYTPLDDQNIVYQVGQIPKQPITEWMTYHQEGDQLTTTHQESDLTDFVEPDTAYAVVLQAVNQDGAGPYSEQHTIRTMSRARESPPLNLRVEPKDQRSANVDWQKPMTSEQSPIGYELYYIKADTKIWEDDLASINDWSMIAITGTNDDTLHYKIDGSLEPDTEYVFRMRAIYSDGASIFSEACITKTLPDGNAPYIMISNGDHGVEGKTEITILPGSALDLSCNATGQPRPSVKWIRGGRYPIDPAWIKSDENYAVWFLKVSNITEDASFNCVAQSSLGFANWTISVRLIPDLAPTWKHDFVSAKNENNEVVLHFTDILPDYLNGLNLWNIYWTDNPSKPFEAWNVIRSHNNPLERIAITDMELGTKYYLVIEQPSAGIKTPVFDIMAPKPASEIRVGTDINGETVLDFKPALAAEPIKKYIIKYWPENDSSAVMYMETPMNVTDKIILDGLQPDTDYTFIVVAKFDDTDNLQSEPSKVRTPSGDIECHCAHACMFEEDEEGVISSSCYCHSGFKLSSDKRSCEPLEEDEEDGIVLVTPPTFFPDSEHPKELSTNPSIFDSLVPVSEKIDSEKSNLTKLGEQEDERLKTDSKATNEYVPTIISEQGLLVTDKSTQPTVTDHVEQIVSKDTLDHTLIPVVNFDSIPFSTNEYGQKVDNLGNPITWDEDDLPIGPNGTLPHLNFGGEYVYPVTDINKKPLPTDINMKPIYPIVGPDNHPIPKNQEGLYIDPNGQVIPTDDEGRPISVDGSPYPTDEEGRFIVISSSDVTKKTLATDELGRNIYPVYYPDGMILPTAENGQYTDERGQIIPTNEIGLPINEHSEVLPTDSEGNFVYVGEYVVPTDSNGQLVKVKYDGKLLKSNKFGNIIGPNGEVLSINEQGHPIDGSNNVFPTASDGTFILLTDRKESELILNKTKQEQTFNILGPDKDLLPTADDVSALDPFVHSHWKPSPADNNEQLIHPESSLNQQLLSTNQSGESVYAIGTQLQKKLSRTNYSEIGLDDKLLQKSPSTISIDPHGIPIPTDFSRDSTDSVGRPLSQNRGEKIIYPISGTYDKPMPTDESGKSVYFIIGPDGELFKKDHTGAVIDTSGRPIPTNFAGIPVDKYGKPLPVDKNGFIIYHTEEYTTQASGTDKADVPIYVIVGPDGTVLEKNVDGVFIDPHGRPIPTDSSGYPTDSLGRPLPRDRSGKIIYPANDVDGEPMSIDESGKPVYTVVGPDGLLLPTNEFGLIIGFDGNPLPTNDFGKPVGPDGSPLPTNELGHIVHFPPEEPPTVLSTNEYGQIVYPIVDTDGKLLDKDDSGFHITKYGIPVELNENHFPVGPDGNILATDSNGNYIFPDVEGMVFPAEKTDGTVYSVTSFDRKLHSTDSSGAAVEESDNLIPTNEFNNSVEMDGKVLPTGKHKYLEINTTASPVTVFGLDSKERKVINVMDSEGRLLSTDDLGRFQIAPGKFLKSDDSGRPIGPDDQLLPTDSSGNYVYLPKEKHPIDDDLEHKLEIDQTSPASESTSISIDQSSKISATDLSTVESRGSALYDHAHNCSTKNGVMDIVVVINMESLDQISFEQIKNVMKNLVDKYFDLAPDMSRFAVIKYSGSAEVPITLGGYNEKIELLEDLNQIKYEHVKEHSRISVGINAAAQQFVSFGREKAGKLILLVTDGQDIYPEDHFDDVIPMLIVGKTKFEEEIRDHTKSYILIEAWPQLRDDTIVKTIREECLRGRIPIPTFDKSKSEEFEISNSSPLPTDEFGQIVIFPTDEPAVMATDEYGHVVFPIRDITGRTLPKNEAGSVVNRLGQLIEFDDFGKPVGPDGRPLMSDESGTYIYPAIDNSGKPVPTDMNKRPIYKAVDENGNPLETDENGVAVDINRQPIPTDLFGRYVDSKGLPYSFDSDENIVIPKLFTKVGDTDNYTISSDMLLPTNTSNTYLNYSEMDRNQKLLPTKEYGKSLISHHSLTATDTAEKYTTDTQSSDKYSQIFQNPDVEPLTTDESGNYIDRQGRPLQVEVDHVGRPIGAIQKLDHVPEGTKLIVVDLYGRPLPTDEYGNTVFADGSTVPTDASGHPIGLDGSVMPLDDRGRYISDYIPDTADLRELEHLTKAQTCDKVDKPANIIFVIESSDAIRTKLTEIKHLLINFIKKNINWAIVKIGLVSYGSTVDVNLDIGNYENYEELEQSIISLPFIGGSGSGDEHAMRTSLQLFREKYSSNNAELIVHIYKTSISKDAQVMANHLRANETIMILSLGAEQWYRLKDEEEMRKLRSDMCLMLMKSQTAQTRKSPEQDFPSKSPTKQEIKQPIHSKKETDGRHVSKDEGIVNTYESPPPTHDQSWYLLAEKEIEKALITDGKPIATDIYKRPIYPVVDAKGRALPTDESGFTLDQYGKPIPTDESGVPLNAHGQPLAKDEYGRYKLDTSDLPAPFLTTDECGKVIYPVFGPEGRLLSTDETGRLVDHKE